MMYPTGSAAEAAVALIVMFLRPWRGARDRRLLEQELTMTIRTVHASTALAIAVFALLLGIEALMAHAAFRGAGLVVAAAGVFVEALSRNRPKSWTVVSWILLVCGFLLYGWGRFGPMN